MITIPFLSKKVPSTQTPTTPLLAPAGLRDWFNHLSLGRKMLAGYGVAFTVTIAGITTGFALSEQAEEKALAIQAEAIEDVENVAKLQDSVLRVVFHSQSILNQLDASEEASVEQFQVALANFVEEVRTFQRSWEDFRESDEFAEGEGEAEADELAGVTENEAAIAADILQAHEASVHDYLQQVDQLFRQGDLSVLTPEQISTAQITLMDLKQSDFIRELGRFLEKTTALAAATEEEQLEATAVLRQASVTQRRLTVGSIVLSGMMGLLLMRMLSRAILRPLREITQVTQKSAQTANFDLQVSVKSRDEVGVLGQNFNVYMQFVRQLLAQQKTTNQELQTALEDLHRTQAQMVQGEKMSSLGQLVAGVAHEINNPVNFIHGNLTHVQEYAQDLLGLLQMYRHHYPQPTAEIQAAAEAMELDFIQDDLPRTLSSMKLGTSRIREIVLSLRNFSRLDESEIKPVNLHEGLDSTLVILNHRFKAGSARPAIQVIREYGALPLVECYAGLLNQVFMNLLSNAVDALDEEMKARSLQARQENPGQITLRTSLIKDEWVQIAISDNGPGISSDIQSRIFDPFFTTKGLGKGTGMGLSISHQIVTEKHHGQLECCSTPGQGTEFVIRLPLRQDSFDQ